MKTILLFLPIIMSTCIGMAAETQTETGTKEFEFDTYISDVAQEACVEYGEEYGIEPEILIAMVEKESGGKPNAENGGCYGDMQINPRWHKDRMERLGVTDLFDERGNILVGTDYLAELLEEYGDLAYALDVYNGNSKAKYNYEHGIVSKFAKYILERSEELKGGTEHEAD